LPDGAFDGTAVISFKDGQAGVEPFTPGHDHDVEPNGTLVSTEDVSNQSFG